MSLPLSKINSEFIDKRDWRKIGGKWVLKSEEMHRGPEVTVQDRATGSQRQGYIWGNEWKESSIPAEPRDLSNHRSPSALPPEPPNPTHDYGPLSPPPLPPNGLRNHTQAATPMIDPGGQSHSGYDAWLSQFSSHPEGPLLETVSLPSEWKDHAEAASNTTPPTGTPHRSSRRNNGGHHSSRR